MSNNELLHKAAVENDFHRALIIVKAGADVLSTDYYGFSVLMRFAAHNNLPAVLALASLAPKALSLQTPHLGINVMQNLALHGNYQGIIACNELSPGTINIVDTYKNNVAMILAKQGCIDGLISIAIISPWLFLTHNNRGDSALTLLAENCTATDLARVGAMCPSAVDKITIEHLASLNCARAIKIKTIARFIKIGVKVPHNISEVLSRHDMCASDLLAEFLNPDL